MWHSVSIKFLFYILMAIGMQKTRLFYYKEKGDVTYSVDYCQLNVFDLLAIFIPYIISKS